jgi:CRP-like cAMP-binding protein
MKAPQEPPAGEKETLPAVLERMEILKSLREDEIRKLSQGARILSFGPGEDVVRQGDEGDSLFIVRRGTLDVRIDDAPVGTLAEGSIFGEMSLLTGERRAATVRASTEVRLAEISREDVEPVIRANPALLESLSAILAERQARNIERMKATQQRPKADGKDVFLQKLKIFFGLS